MNILNRILPFLLCFVLAVSAASSFSAVYASETGPVPFSMSEEEEGNGSANTGMFDTTAALGKALLDGIWSLFGIYVPGFSFTFGQLWVGVFLASVSILAIRMIFGFGGSGPSGVSSRTSSTDNPKISKERRHDEF